MSKAYVSIPVGYYRLDAEPLEKNTRFYSYAEACDYAANDPTAYPGQILSVKDSDNADKWSVYTITSDLKLSAVHRLHTMYFTSDTNNDKVKMEHGRLTVKAPVKPVGFRAPNKLVYNFDCDYMPDNETFSYDFKGFNITGIWEILFN